MLNAILFACLLLGLGSVMRFRLRVLQQLYLPAAIVGGGVGLALLQLATHWEAGGFESWPLRILDARQQGPLFSLLNDVRGQLVSWPGQLIAVIFAGLFLERKSRSFRESAVRAGREGLMVWIIVLGQTTLGLLATWLLIQPFYDVPNSFGMLIETGFAGGHATAAAMGEVLDSEIVRLDDGRDLGMFMATIGLIISVVTGMAYVNLAVRRGWTRHRDIRVVPVQGLEDRDQPPAIARGPVRSEVIEPMVFQLLVLAAAFFVGIVLATCVNELAKAFEHLSGEAGGTSSAARILRSFPLFIYTLFGGLAVRKTMEYFSIDDLIDPSSMQRLVGVAMEFLVVSAIATLNLTAVVRFAVPLFVLVLVALIWTGVCLIWLSRWFLPPGYWFELGIVNYGMSTGTTATGFVLLRVIDKDLDSGAAEDYAMAAPLSSPFIGGGMLTIGLPPLVLEQFPIALPALVLSGLMVGLLILAWFLADRAGTS